MAEQTEKGFLRDKSGKPSAMRLMSFIALTASMVFAAMTIRAAGPNGTHETGTFISATFLIAAFAPKALQKFIEDYLPDKPRN